MESTNIKYQARYNISRLILENFTRVVLYKN